MIASILPADWPFRDASRFIQAGGVNWHVQRVGSGPAILMIHGTAASTHSFRALAARLADDFELVMADLPGHGFSGPLDAPTLPRNASAMGALTRALGVEPALVVGHSAGAAIALRMALDGACSPSVIVGLAPALKPYGGAADGLASGLAKLAFINPITPRFVAMRASPVRVKRIIERTGSHIDEAGCTLYKRLLERPSHVSGALKMMANWRLRPTLEALPRLAVRFVAVAGDADRATPERDIVQAVQPIPDRDTVVLQGLGHLAHEEDPDAVAAVIRREAQRAGLFDPASKDQGRLNAVR
ncbi:MAG: alpha/beta fold hydrolase [Alphaproteobacteria bacterium]|nr:alpha/beta fold hydrolase [Alphaproteobacteria bacterium]